MRNSKVKLGLGARDGPWQDWGKTPKWLLHPLIRPIGDDFPQKTGQMNTNCGSRARALLFVFCFCALSLLPGRAQTADDSVKPLKRVVPEYPAVLSRMGLGGVVRLQVNVAPDGTVQEIEVKGGGAILAEAAIKAVKQWKFPSSAQKKTIDVVVEFDCCHTIKMTP
jgi:TonB family protein